jgi:hypothetical protein
MPHRFFSLFSRAGSPASTARARALLLASCQEPSSASAYAQAQRAIGEGALVSMDPWAGSRSLAWEALLHGNTKLAELFALHHPCLWLTGAQGSHMLLRAAVDEEMPWTLRPVALDFLMKHGARATNPCLLECLLYDRLDGLAERILQDLEHLGAWDFGLLARAPLAPMALALGNPHCALTLLSRAGGTSAPCGHAGLLAMCALAREDHASRRALPFILAMLTDSSERLSAWHAQTLSGWLGLLGFDSGGRCEAYDMNPRMQAIHLACIQGSRVVDAAIDLGADHDEVALGLALQEQCLLSVDPACCADKRSQNTRL